MRSAFMKLTVWIAIITLVVTALAPVIYSLAPNLLAKQETAIETSEEPPTDTAETIPETPSN